MISDPEEPIIRTEATLPDERRQLLRILDANRNRALEALRVIEEHARFALSDERLSTKAKDLRHRVHLALDGHAELKDLAASRDVGADPQRPKDRGEPGSHQGPRARRD